MCKRTTAPLLVLALLLLLFAPDFFAASFGQIKGVITDAETGEPVVNASVMVVGTRFGCSTDPDGKYTVLRLEPGIYDLRISSIEYNTVEVTDVVVEADLTTEINQKLTRKAGDLDKIIQVIGKSDIIDRFETENKLTITSEPFQHKPVQKVDAIADPVAGVQIQDSKATRNSGQNKFHALARCGKIDYCLRSIKPCPGREQWRLAESEPFDAMFFKNYGVNPFVDAENDPLSTFAVDVDDASYVMTRAYLERGELPPKKAIRTEEFVNHFDYSYEPPDFWPFSIHLEGAPSHFGSDDMYLLRIGIKGREMCERQRKPANLVFVVDVSGSMERENRLETVKKALRMYLRKLQPADRVGIVSFETRGRVVLRPVTAHNVARIYEGIDKLYPMGSTNVEHGLRLGLQMAREMFHKDKINRIILLSDGVANTGTISPEKLLEQMTEFTEMGITLTTVGVGMGNYNDVLLEQLGDKGNGHYAYIDDLEEARRFFMNDLVESMEVIARDVKIQIEFDPDVVHSYRLLGYENRDVEDESFRYDGEDGGEIGSGHSITALYEFKYNRGAKNRDIGKVFIRYKSPDRDEVSEVSGIIAADVFRYEFDEASSGFRLAVAAAEFAEILKNSYWARNSELGEVHNVLSDIYSETEDENIQELMRLVDDADHFQKQMAKR